MLIFQHHDVYFTFLTYKIRIIFLLKGSAHAIHMLLSNYNTTVTLPPSFLTLLCFTFSPQKKKN